MSNRQKYGERKTAPRRSVLQTVGSALALGVGSVGTVTARGKNKSRTPAADGTRGFPPNGLTQWGPSRTVGNGNVRVFTVETPSGQLKHHGIYIERAALDGLPSPDALQTDAKYDDPYGDHGEGTEIHGRYSQQFFIPLPESDSSPFTFISLNWNPNGHPIDGVWTVPHFDIHFHMTPSTVVEEIDGPRAPEYEFPDRYRPEGYIRSPNVDERVITYMGEHLADSTAPELEAGQSEFANTLIWGVYDPTDSGVAELTFVEPMVTLDYLRNATGVDTRDVRQPAAYRRSGHYPTEYTVRDVPAGDGIAVTIDSFEYVDGDHE